MLSGAANRDAILRAKTGACDGDEVKRFNRMLAVVALDCLLQLRERCEVFAALEFLLAFPAGEDQLTLPGGRVCLEVCCHRWS